MDDRYTINGVTFCPACDKIIGIDGKILGGDTRYSDLKDVGWFTSGAWFCSKECVSTAYSGNITTPDRVFEIYKRAVEKTQQYLSEEIKKLKEEANENA